MDGYLKMFGRQTVIDFDSPHVGKFEDAGD